MRFGEVILDTNLSLLLILGLTDRSLIEKHKRLQAFDTVDFGILQEAINASSGFAISPNIATEVSNLLGFSAGRDQQRLSAMYSKFINLAQENYVPSKQTTSRRELFTSD